MQTEEIIASLYDEIKSDGRTVTDINNMPGFNSDMSDVFTDNPVTEREFSARLESGDLVVSTTGRLLPYGATFYDTRTLRQRISEYFSSCQGPAKDRTGEILYDLNGLPVMAQTRPFTLAGLALTMGVETRRLKDFARGDYDTLTDKYSHWVKMAAQQIEEYAETRLYDKTGYQGGQFILDSAFGRTIRKDMHDIKKARFDRKRIAAELSMKLDALGMSDTDSTLSILVEPASRDISTSEILNLDEEE